MFKLLNKGYPLQACKTNLRYETLNIGQQHDLRTLDCIVAIAFLDWSSVTTDSYSLKTYASR